MAKPQKNIVRLPRHRSRADQAAGIDVRQLLREQSLRNAIYASLIAIIVFSILWVMVTRLTDRVFPWMTVVLGVLLGLAVRRAGRGLDWRFPLLAAAMTVLGALVGNVVVAASGTAEEFGTTTLHVLRAVTSMTWPVFFDEVVSVADAVYAAFSAGVAAFFANRRLTRAEYYALRTWREEGKHGGED